MKIFQWLRQQLQLNKTNGLKYTGIWLGWQLSITLCVASIMLYPAWRDQQKVKTQWGEQQQLAKTCQQQTAMQKQLQNELTKLNSQQSMHTPINVFFTHNKHWQGQLLQWLHQHHIQVLQFENNDSPDDNQSEQYQLVAHSDWLAFLCLFNQLQLAMPYLSLHQIQLSIDSQQPTRIQFIADIKVNHD